MYGEGVKDFYIIGYSNSDFAGDVEDRKTTSEAVFFLGGLLITWNSLMQKAVALSFCEAKYIAVIFSLIKECGSPG